jgi:hypothetical protein
MPLGLYAYNTDYRNATANQAGHYAYNHAKNLARPNASPHRPSLRPFANNATITRSLVHLISRHQALRA